jgi:hypothetical protein
MNNLLLSSVGLVMLVVGCSKKADDAKPDFVSPLGSAPLVAADMHHVDIVDIVKQAHAPALAKESHARLTRIIAHRVTGGLIDATSPQACETTYEYSYLDPSKPPGQDKVAGMINVGASMGHLETLGGLPVTQHSPGYIDEPTCRSKDAWQTAINTGVPANAVAEWQMYAKGPGTPLVWSLSVDGHDEYRREIDGVGCKLVKSWAKK